MLPRQPVNFNAHSHVVIVGRGMIACNTPALQDWWDGKKHHSAKTG
jgi:hypothetical protein